MAVVTAMIALALAPHARTPSVRLELAGLIAALVGCGWLGRPTGALAVNRPVSTARRLRQGSWVVVGCVVVGVSLPPGPHDPGAWPFGVAIVLYLLAALHLTSKRLGVAAVDLRTGLLSAAAGTGLWWLAMLSAGAIRQHPLLVPCWLTIVFLATLFVGSPTRQVRHCVLCALGGAAASCLLIFLAAVATYAVAPRLAPDIAGNTCCAGGLTAADRAQTNRTEAVDPYVVELLLGGVLSALIVGGDVLRARNRIERHDDVSLT